MKITTTRGTIYLRAVDWDVESSVQINLMAYGIMIRQPQPFGKPFFLPSPSSPDSAFSFLFIVTPQLYTLAVATSRVCKFCQASNRS